MGDWISLSCTSIKLSVSKYVYRNVSLILWFRLEMYNSILWKNYVYWNSLTVADDDQTNSVISNWNCMRKQIPWKKNYRGKKNRIHQLQVINQSLNCHACVQQHTWMTVRLPFLVNELPDLVQFVLTELGAHWRCVQFYFSSPQIKIAWELAPHSIHLPV